MEKSNSYFIISARDINLRVVNSTEEVEATLFEVVAQLKIISQYLKANKIKDYNKIPSRDKKKIFTNGISEDSYTCSRFPIQYHFSISKWNGNYFEDVTKKFRNVIKALPEVEEHRIIFKIKP